MNLSVLKAEIRQAKSERVSKIVGVEHTPTVIKVCVRTKCSSCNLCKVATEPK